MRLKVAVVGAGVIGCSVALHLYQELYPHVSVTVLADQFSPYTTSDAAGAILIPFDVRDKKGSGNDPNIERWTRATFKHFRDLYHSDEAGLVDVQLVNGHYAEEGMAEGGAKPWWADLTTGFRCVGARERLEMNIPDHFKSVYSFSTYIVNGRKLLPWMMKKLQQKGVSFVQKKVKELSELNEYDVVINCTGLGSYELLGDHSLYPVHGDAILVRAPWIKQFYFFLRENNYTYIFPRSEDVLLGGTGRKDDWSKSPDKTSTDAIMDCCSTLIPSLAHAPIIKTWAGLRPARDSVRLEKDPVGNGSTVIIHCYGHGGQGVALSWGCAVDVGVLVSKHLQSVGQSKL